MSRQLVELAETMDNMTTANMSTEDIQSLRDILLDSDNPLADDFEELTELLDKLQGEKGKKWLLIEID
jgi:thioredoxin-like negative regulator of GroEL